MYRLQPWHVILGWAPELYFQLYFYGDQVHICGFKASLTMCVCIPLPLCLYYRCAFWYPHCTLLMARIVVLKVILFSGVIWQSCDILIVLMEVYYFHLVSETRCAANVQPWQRTCWYTMLQMLRNPSLTSGALCWNLELETKMYVLRRCTEPLRAAKMRGMLSGVWVTPVILEA